jgi:FKBP-type peptidyl-prolyl cis-trans isomerase
MNEATSLKEGQHVTCAVRCTLANGEVVSERPKFEFVVGSGKCLPGFEAAVKIMNPVEPKTSILLKSPYGKRGLPPNIPGDSDLLFEITLLQVDDKQISASCEVDPSLYSAA